MSNGKKIRFKKGTIKNYRVERIPLPGGRNQPKIILQIETEDGKDFEISEIFFKKDDQEFCQGLWLNLDSAGEIANKSTLKQLLDYFNVKEILELKQQTVKIRTNTQNYYTIDCCGQGS